jgi:myo-inositol 2-dehydrogenase / D-chiro-inositol 1-dehydrogenase
LSAVAVAGAEGIVGDKPPPFFLERYAEAYRLELDHFVDAHPWAPPRPGGSGGVKALALADAALRSQQTGRAIAL